MGAQYVNDITVYVSRAGSDEHPDTKFVASLQAKNSSFGTTIGYFADVADARSFAGQLALLNRWHMVDHTDKPCVVTITPTLAASVTLDFDHEPSVDEMRDKLEELASELTPAGYAAEHIVTNGGGFSFEVQTVPS